ncbi:hypothetical protein V6N13_092809 [Hibiscus sabdariffa]
MENPTGVTAATDGLLPFEALGGRPPDAVIAVEESILHERSGPPLDEDRNQVVKKGRNIFNASGVDGSIMPSVSTGSDIFMGGVGGDGFHQSTQVVVGLIQSGPSIPSAKDAARSPRLVPGTCKASFRDMLLGDRAVEDACGRESSATAMVTDVVGDLRKCCALAGDSANIVCNPEGSSVRKDSMVSSKDGETRASVGASIASVTKVVPVATSLQKAKHIVVQVGRGGENHVLREKNGRVLPSLFHGSSKKDRIHGVQGLRGKLKSGSIVKKRDERGSSTVALANCLSSLVSNLNQATGSNQPPVSMEGLQGRGETDVQWSDNMVFDQQVGADMQD